MATPAREIEPLDELRLLVVVDNEVDTMSSVAEGVPQIPNGVHLAARVPVVREHEGRPCRVVLDRLCRAGHGFSVLVTGRRGAVEHTMLCDVGAYGDLWLDNAARLGVDLASIETLFLSHWHADHSGPLPQVVGAIAAARKAARRAPLVVSLHPDRPDQRGILQPNNTLTLLPPEPTFEAVEAAGGRVVREADTHVLCDGFFLGSGRIDRVTEYEQGLVGHYSFRGDHATADPLILDERFLAARVRGRGVSVVSSCSHAGVVNAALSAHGLFPEAPIDLVLGGYHLVGRAMEARVDETVRDLRDRVRPRLVAPGHCTGWRAKAALAQTFAPSSRYAPSAVGAMYVLVPPS